MGQPYILCEPDTQLSMDQSILRRQRKISCIRNNSRSHTHCSVPCNPETNIMVLCSMACVRRMAVQIKTNHNINETSLE